MTSSYAGPAFFDQTSNSPFTKPGISPFIFLSFYLFIFLFLHISILSFYKYYAVRLIVYYLSHSREWLVEDFQKEEMGLPKALPVFSRIDADLLLLDSPSPPFVSFGSYAWGLFGIRMASSSGIPPRLPYLLSPLPPPDILLVLIPSFVSLFPFLSLFFIFPFLVVSFFFFFFELFSFRFPAGKL